MGGWLHLGRGWQAKAHCTDQHSWPSKPYTLQGTTKEGRKDEWLEGLATARGLIFAGDKRAFALLLPLVVHCAEMHGLQDVGRDPGSPLSHKGTRQRSERELKDTQSNSCNSQQHVAFVKPFLVN